MKMVEKQQIQITANYVIPEQFIIVDRVEFESMKLKLESIWITLDEALENLPFKKAWFRENILIVPKFRKRLDVKNGGCIDFPVSERGGRYKVHREMFRKWCDENLAEVFREIK